MDMLNKFHGEKKKNIALIIHISIAIVLIFSLWYHNGFLIFLIIIAFILGHVWPDNNKNKSKVDKKKK